MNDGIFSYADYLQKIQQQLQHYLETGKKYYIEMEGNALNQSSFHTLLEDFPTNAYQEIFREFRNDLDIYICIKSETIIKHYLEEETDLYNQILTDLKKMENIFGKKPNLVINFIDIENMYDIVFNFATSFQKIGYKTREKYKMKRLDFHVDNIFTEVAMENDDHIPAMKNLNLMFNFEPQSGRFLTSLTQMYLDNSIGIESEYRSFSPLCNLDLPSTHPLNLLGEAWFIQYLSTHHEEKTETFYEKLMTEREFVKKCYEALDKEIPESFALGSIEEKFLKMDHIISFFKQRCEVLKHNCA